MRKLSNDGLLLMNVTNRFLDLMPVVGNLVADAGLAARFSRGFVPTVTPQGRVADYIVVAREERQLARFDYIQPPWPKLAGDPRGDLWSDDFTNIVRVLRWRDYELGPE
jgi:hypothetical protein